MVCQRLLLAVLTLSIAGHVAGKDVDVVAQGSVGLVFPAKTAISTAEKPLTANVGELWCQAYREATEKAEVIDNARFLHITGHQTHAAELRNGHQRAFLAFHNATLTAAGKYKCDLTLGSGDRVGGNMFIYMRPVFHDSRQNIEFVEERENFTVIAKPVYVKPQNTAVLRCPVLGYPKPDVEWYKGSDVVVPSDRMRLNGTHLEIHDATTDDEGIYRCVASNKFSTLIDEGPEFTFQSSLEQELRISSWPGWIFPLILIILMIILLILIIYGCAFCKRRMSHADNYDVAKREKKLRAVEEQRLHDESDAED
ncbi:hypothetical protein QR680_004629 [Steinernema hermaphroditum]|uniref:Ig-like domain-containing protein n=1 Tax=Steinernema hermaphroditum TaxID=289476 RepID=A0AA39HQR1_9BILA|nr:hypothetical protein QR680_004629 [Steinernema hermaphroditum]